MYIDLSEILNGDPILWGLYYGDYIMETILWRPNIMETILYKPNYGDYIHHGDLIMETNIVVTKYRDLIL